MEYVNGTTLAELIKFSPEGDQQERYGQIAEAIGLFLASEVPDHATPRPVAGGIIKHPIFKDTVVSLKYDSVRDLQEHMTIIANSPFKNNITIDFTGEPLCFCFADLFEGNFIVTAMGSLYIVDFHHAAFLPTSFMTYAFDQPCPVCAAIKDKFDLPTKHLADMRVAGSYFMVSSRKAGLSGGQTDQYVRGRRDRGVYATGMDGLVNCSDPEGGLLKVASALFYLSEWKTVLRAKKCMSVSIWVSGSIGNKWQELVQDSFINLAVRSKCNYHFRCNVLNWVLLALLESSVSNLEYNPKHQACNPA